MSKLTILMVFIIIAVALVLGYVSFIKPETAVPVQPTPSPTITPTSEPTSTPTPSSTATPSPMSDNTSIPTSTPDDISKVDTSDWKTYRNEKYGFEIKFPLSWKDYLVETKKLELDSIGKYDSINFGFDIQKSLFNINVFTKDQWGKVVSSEVDSGRTEPDYIDKNKKFFFNVAAAQYAENQEMSDRMSEIKYILSTFKFTD